MNMVGKTVVKGHGLLDEGHVRYDGEGRVATFRVPTDQRHARCRCGELSPAGISQYAAKKWHRQHKADVLATQQR